MSKSTNPILRFFRGIWNGIDATRRVAVNLLFLVIVVGLLILVFKNNLPIIEDGAALVIAPRGALVEQLTAPSVDQLIDQATGSATQETLLKDVIDAITAAKDDDRLKVLVLELSSFSGARLTKLQDVAEAIAEFKTSGKKVIAIADNYSMNSYYLAAQADEVLMHKMGAVMIEGMGRYRMFYKDGLDKLGATVNVFKVGTYKSAVEPYLLNGMSDAAKEADQEWLGDLWRIYLEDVGAARSMSAAEIDRYANDFGPLMADANGDSAKAALDFGLVDYTQTRVEMRQHLIDLVGEDESTHSYRRVSMDDYLTALELDRFGQMALGNKVAVIVARGTILDGTQPPGAIGGDSTGALIRQARNDENVKAIVLRVDSGGGSAFASEVIRRELEAARAAGIPVIASMGSVAASGGYWISTSSDQIWAHPSTITGSIGIFAIFPTFEQPLAEHLGIRVDGVTTAPLAGVRPDRALPEEVGVVIQQMIEQGYRDFLTRVADARDMSIEDVDAIAQGRVWSGEDALALGLVDNLGGLADAIQAAAGLAELGDDYTVSYTAPAMEFKDKLLNQMTSRALHSMGLGVSSPSPLNEVLGQLEEAAGKLAALNDPNHIYAWSTIETD